MILCIYMYTHSIFPYKYTRRCYHDFTMHNYPSSVLTWLSKCLDLTKCLSAQWIIFSPNVLCSCAGHVPFTYFFLFMHLFFLSP